MAPAELERADRAQLARQFAEELRAVMREPPKRLPRGFDYDAFAEELWQATSVASEVLAVAQRS